MEDSITFSLDGTLESDEHPYVSSVGGTLGGIYDPATDTDLPL